MEALSDDKYLHPDELDLVMRQLDYQWHWGLAKGLRTPTRNAIAFRSGLELGLRASEICKLQRSNVELEGRRPTMVIRNSKGGKTRVLPVPQDLRKMLLLWSEFSASWSEGSLFPNRCGKQWKRNSAWLAWSNCLKDAQVRHVPLHAVRHTAALRLYRESKNLRLVQKMLGHASINTTTIYADVMEEDIPECLNRTFLPFGSVQQPKNQG